MKRGLLLATGLLLFASQTWGADPFAHPATGEVLLQSVLARPAAQLRKSQSLRGPFKHSRHLRELPKPLVSSGEFVFARDLGVYWHTRQPFDSVIVLTEKAMVQRDEGAPPIQVSAGEQPAVRLIAEIFSALFTLDVKRLEKNFELSGVSEGERWTIGLKPRSAAASGTLGQVMEKIIVEGSNDVERVILFHGGGDSQGDRTVIELGKIEYSAAAPGADLRALFALPR